jgi:uncharacterized protein YndB with AHSA1/START domain
LEAKVAGAYKMSFTNFTTGKSHSFGGTYLELTPHERIRYTDIFDDPNLPGEMQTTIALKEVFCGTEMIVTQEGIPAAIPAEACYLGWQESLSPRWALRRKRCQKWGDGLVLLEKKVKPVFSVRLVFPHLWDIDPPVT